MYEEVMIPGTKPRQTQGDAPTALIPEKEVTPVAAASVDPSQRSYSRRELLTQLPNLFGEGLVKLLRTSNHLETELRSQLQQKWRE